MAGPRCPASACPVCHGKLLQQQGEFASWWSRHQIRQASLSPGITVARHNYGEGGPVDQVR